MKNVGKQTAALLLSAFLLASCSSNGEKSGSTAAKTSQPTSAATSGTSASPAAEPSGGVTATPSPQASPQEAVPEASSAPAQAGVQPSGDEVPILYHMNKNYDIIPNEEGTPKKVVLLTFDDGPKEAKLINSIMDMLDKHNAKAIFFVNGYRVKENPELLKLIQTRGGIIGNHSWDHITLKDKPYAVVKKQIEDVQKAVKDITGEAPRFFRPPFGAGGDVGKKVAAENGMLAMNWSVGSLDWEIKESDADKTKKLIGNITDQLHSGSNILMHELPWTAEALDTLLSTLESKGYSFVDPRSIELKMN
jgi:peptidoglycan-N-acetylglucosamine deacetylase